MRNNWMILFIALGIMFSCTPSLVAQSQSGTVIVFLYSTDKAIIAADSRAKTSKEVEGKIITAGFTDEECKIMALGKDIVCAMHGYIRNSGPQGFDCQSEVREIFLKLKSAKHGESLISDLSKRFAESISSQIRLWYLANPLKAELFIRNNAQVESDGQIGIVCAIFAGIGDDGAPCIYGVRIRYFPNSKEMPIVSKIDGRLSAIGKINGMGKMDIVNEIVTGASERAKAENLQWEREAVAIRKSGKDPDELRVIRLVDLTIAYLEDGNSPDVGGQIDAVKITPGGQPIRWIQRKANCRTD